MDKKQTYSSEFDNTANYTIVVRGRISPGSSFRIEGMAISYQLLEDGTAVTVLKGLLEDQAALNGVINAIYELQMPIVSVEKSSG